MFNLLIYDDEVESVM